MCAALSASTQAPFADGQNVGLPSDRTQVGFALERGGGNGGNDEARSKFAQIYTKIK